MGYKFHQIQTNREMNITPEIIEFAQLMEKELMANSHKGYWKNLSLIYLHQELYYHSYKLRDAIKSKDKELILEYAADCGNLAMMIVDNIKSELTETEKGE